MTDQGVRITFEDEGPYLFPLINVDPVVRYLPEQSIVLMQCANIYIPISIDAGQEVIQALLDLEQAEEFEDSASYQALEMPAEGVVETPLLTSVQGPAKQLDNIVLLDVLFDTTRVVVPLSVKAAADMGQALSLVPPNQSPDTEPKQ